MRRKRLQHTADTICRMFCGWRLVNCMPQLVDLGSGTIHIDVLTGSCSFDGEAIPRRLFATYGSLRRTWGGTESAARQAGKDNFSPDFVHFVETEILPGS